MSSNDEKYDESLMKILENSSFRPSRPITRSKSLGINSIEAKQPAKKRRSEKIEVDYEESGEEAEEISNSEAEVTSSAEVKGETFEKGKATEGKSEGEGRSEGEGKSEGEGHQLEGQKNNKKHPLRENYEEVLEKIREMRKQNDAPVDLVGSHLNFDPNADEATRNFQWLTSILLSVQTKDERTHQVMKRLLEKGLSLEYVYKISEKELYELIFEINFNKKKATYLKQVARIIKEDLNSKIPDTVEELIKLPGIGKKIAILYVQFVKGIDVGIAVDTHVHRISNRLNWVKTTVPDKTREGLESFIDKKYWSEANQLLVGFGQQICQPVNPKCGICLLNDLCPEGRRNKRAPHKNVRTKTK